MNRPERRKRVGKQRKLKNRNPIAKAVKQIVPKIISDKREELRYEEEKRFCNGGSE